MLKKTKDGGWERFGSLYFNPASSSCFCISYYMLLFLFIFVFESARAPARRARVSHGSVSTFPPVLESRVHWVYTDTADSCDTPPNSHAPRLGQSSSDHVLITRCLHLHWSISATPLFLIGHMLPPASLLWILFLFFFLLLLRPWSTQLRLWTLL